MTAEQTGAPTTPASAQVHWRAMFDSRWLYAHDLNGKDVTLTISKVEKGELLNQDQKTEHKPVLSFVEPKSNKRLVLNKTNAKTVATLYGNSVSGWVGKRITLYPTTTRAFGQTVDCIRIRPQVPK